MKYFSQNSFGGAGLSARLGLSTEKRTELKRQNRLKQEGYQKQKKCQFSKILERSGAALVDYVESQNNLFLASSGGNGLSNDSARADDFAIDETRNDAPLNGKSSEKNDLVDFAPTFVSDDGETGDDVFTPRARLDYDRTSGATAQDSAENFEFDPPAPSGTTLRDHLLEQLRLDERLNERSADRKPAQNAEVVQIRVLCEKIVDRLDAAGYFTNEQNSSAKTINAASPKTSAFNAFFNVESTPDDRVRAQNALAEYFAPDATKIGRKLARQEFDSVVGKKTTKAERERARQLLEAESNAANVALDAASEPLDALFARTPTPNQRELAEKALKIVRSLDPPGVGARNLQDALLLRLRPDAQYYREMRRLLSDCFDEFLKKKLPALNEKTGLSLETLRQIYDAPFPFYPSPDAIFERESKPSAIRAEIVVEKSSNDRWTVRLDETRAAFVLEPRYRKMLLAKNLDPATKEYLRQKYVEARTLLDALANRDSTLLRVAKAVVDFQSDSLESSKISPRPLTRLQIADKIGLAPSTVSRACKEKWLATPRGLVAFKSLLPKAVAGEETSTDISDKIRTFVENEDSNAPLNDEKIRARLLSEFAIDVARKTVQEYRKRAQIPNSRERKRIAQLE